MNQLVPKRSHSLETTGEIEQRLIDGEHLNVDMLITEYYPELHPLEATMMIRSRLTSARRRLERNNLVVCLVSRKTFGIPKTKQEYIYGQMWYARQVKGLVKHALNLYNFGRQENFIPANFKQVHFRLPVITEKE